MGKCNDDKVQQIRGLVNHQPAETDAYCIEDIDQLRIGGEAYGPVLMIFWHLKANVTFENVNKLLDFNWDILAVTYQTSAFYQPEDYSA